MEDLVETVTRGNVTEVKVILTSVVAALAVYQVLLMAVGYGKLRPPFLAAAPASATHRAIGDSIVVVTVVIAVMCLSLGFEDDGATHAIAGAVLFVVIAFKIAVIRRWHRLSHLLPALGISVLLLFAFTWATSAGDFLANGP